MGARAILHTYRQYVSPLDLTLVELSRACNAELFGGEGLKKGALQGIARM